MALTLRSWLTKPGFKVTLGGIKFDKSNLVRWHQPELFSSLAAVPLKTTENNVNHTFNNQIISSPSPSVKMQHMEFEHREKGKYGCLSNVLGSKNSNLVTNSIKLKGGHLRLVSQPKPNIKQETDNVADFTENQNEDKNIPDDRPSPDKLNHVFNVLADSLPKLFIKSFDYNMYHPDIIFEDNIHGRRSVGLYPYIKQISLLRVIGHVKYAYVKLDILKITQHPEDSTVKVRWTISGISGLKVIILFWKYRIWDIKKLFEKTVPWYDGFSTFHVNGDGKIYKHVVDKMMPDMDREETRSSRTSPIDAAKLTLIVGIIPKCSDINSFF